MNRFDEAAATWDTDAKLERTRRIAAQLREQLPLRGDERVLDVGAGTGQLSLHLADAVGQVVVSDASSGMVAVARKNIEAAGLADCFEAVQLDLTTDDDPLDPEIFDGAWSMLALHHIVELDRLLNRIHDGLRPGGWLAIIDLERDEDGAFHAHVGEDFEGHNGFDPDELRAQLRSAGFTEITFAAAGIVEGELEEADPGAHQHDHGHGHSHAHEGHHDHGDGQGRQTRAFPMFLMTATRP